MENRETAKARARGKIGLLAVVLLCGTAGGMFAEYRRMISPTAQAVVVYRVGNGEGIRIDKPLSAVKAAVSADEAKAGEARVDDSVSARQAADEAVLAADEAKARQEDEAVLAADEAKAQQADEAKAGEVSVLSAFLDYMQQARDQADEVLAGESVLGKIKQNVSATEDVVSDEAKAAVDEARVEIYDSEKGVVGVIELPKQAETERAAGALDVDEAVTETAREGKANEAALKTEDSDFSAAEDKKPAKEAASAERVAEDGAAVLELRTQEVEQAAESETLNLSAQVLQQQVNEDLKQAAGEDGEAPVILLPGMQNSPMENVEAENAATGAEKAFVTEATGADKALDTAATGAEKALGTADRGADFSQFQRESVDAASGLAEVVDITSENEETTAAEEAAINMLEGIVQTTDAP